ncbi:MAG: RNA polymerase sigma-70 factor [Bacteroidales bacterium]|jgi:RNA polymerase sigma-70 factor (ECF subfamily)|nr:RNA polymerase sigma-70 factor [Bacteroidales bacterium]
MNNTPDNILINKINEGNKSAFDILFFKYYKPLYQFALNLCKSEIIAEESVQHTFIKIWENKNFKPNDEVIKLLFTYTKNQVIDELRKNNTRKKYEESAIKEIIIDENRFDEDKQRIKAILETAINQLPKKSKEIFRLAKQEGLSTKEIAKHLKVSKKTVENQLTIAYKKMRQYLEPYKNQLNF